MALPKPPKRRCGVHTPLNTKIAISEVVSAVLLIMMAVAIGTSIYLYVTYKCTDMFADVSLWRSVAEEKIWENLAVLATAYNRTSNTVLILVYNPTKRPIEVVAAYVGPSPSQLTAAQLNDTHVRIAPDKVALLRIYPPFDASNYQAIYVRLTLMRGTTIDTWVYTNYTQT